MEFKHRNASSNEEPFWYTWDSEKKDLWVREMPECAITEHPKFYKGLSFQEFTEKRAIKKIALISAKHPNVLALSCSDKFPNKETIEIRELISYDTIKSTDTLYKDSLINNEIIRYVYLPSKTITKTIKRYKKKI